MISLQIIVVLRIIKYEPCVRKFSDTLLPIESVYLLYFKFISYYIFIDILCKFRGGGKSFWGTRYYIVNKLLLLNCCFHYFLASNSKHEYFQKYEFCYIEVRAGSTIPLKSTVYNITFIALLSIRKKLLHWFRWGISILNDKITKKEDYRH